MAAIIAPEEEREIIGDNTIVFINKGEKGRGKAGAVLQHILPGRRKIFLRIAEMQQILLRLISENFLFFFQNRQHHLSLITRSDKNIYTGQKSEALLNRLF